MSFCTCPFQAIPRSRIVTSWVFFRARYPLLLPATLQLNRVAGALYSAVFCAKRDHGMAVSALYHVCPSPSSPPEHAFTLIARSFLSIPTTARQLSSIFNRIITRLVLLYIASSSKLARAFRRVRMDRHPTCIHISLCDWTFKTRRN